MDTLNQLIELLRIIIRIGVAFRVGFCIFRIILNNDEGGIAENIPKIKSAVLLLIFNECIWEIRDLVFNYYSIGGTS